MFFKKIRPRDFEYIPRYYDPEKDPEERLKRRLGFNRKRKFKRKGRNPVYWLVIFIIILYFYLKLKGLI
ncbi:hypothetical protein [Rosettibacter firmus]|uniref:hypothetical protein n=1 Tax=Rosettibacter firmus TaxID=3111522 RepID=UPI00336C13D0